MPVHALDTPIVKHPEFVTANKLLNEKTYKLSHAQINLEDEMNGSNLFDSQEDPYQLKIFIKKIFKKIVDKK